MRYPQGRPYTTYGYGSGASAGAGTYPATSYRTGVTGQYAGEAYRQGGPGSIERESDISGQRTTDTFERGTSGTFDETAQRGYGQRTSGTFDEQRGTSFEQGSQGQGRTDYAPGEANPAGRSGRRIDELDDENESPIR
jgi:hypothetical protein